MESISFFTPVDFGSHAKTFTESLTERVDNYFYLGGKKAYVIPAAIVNGSQGVEIVEEEQSLLKTCIKVATYFTLVLPVILMVLKVLLRGSSDFHIVEQREPSRCNTPEPKMENPIDESEGDGQVDEGETEKGNGEMETDKSASDPASPRGDSGEIPKTTESNPSLKVRVEQVKNEALKTEPSSAPPSTKPPLTPEEQILSDLTAYTKRITLFESTLVEHKAGFSEAYIEIKPAVDEVLMLAKDVVYPLGAPITLPNLQAWEKLMGTLKRALPYLAVRLRWEDPTGENSWRKVAWDYAKDYEEADRIYCCLAEAYQKLGNREKCIQMATAVTWHSEETDRYFISEANTLEKEGSRAAAVEMATKVKNATTQGRLLISYAESFYAEGNVVNALQTASRISDSKVKKPFLDKVLDQRRALARKSHQKQINGEREKAIRAMEKVGDDVKHVFNALLAEDYYYEGELVKALLVIKDVSLGIRSNFLDNVALEKKPLAHKEDGSLVIGSIDAASSTINVSYSSAIKDAFYAVLAADLIQSGQKEQARKAAENISDSKIKGPLLEQAKS